MNLENTNLFFQRKLEWFGEKIWTSCTQRFNRVPSFNYSTHSCKDFKLSDTLNPCWKYSIWKGIYPHTYNTPENFSTIKRFPCLEVFRNFNDSASDIKSKENWVEENSKDPNSVFDFNLQIYLYCSYDVTILRDVVGNP